MKFRVDSQMVLKYIKNTKRNSPTFAMNRLNGIRQEVEGNVKVEASFQEIKTTRFKYKTLA